MKRALIAMLALLVMAGGAWWFVGHGRDLATQGVAIGGGDGGGLPRATPGDEHLNAGALATLRSAAEQRGADVLLVARHGHLLLDYYTTPPQSTALIGGGDLSAALLAQLSDATPAAPALLAEALSRQLWQPLNAQPARLIDGKVYAHPADWLRVGLLLLGGGQFEGTEVTNATRIADVHYDNSAPSGEALASRDARALRAPGKTILWMVPALQLAVLQSGGSAADTDFINPLIRAVEDQPAAAAQHSLLNQLVPGH